MINAGCTYRGEDGMMCAIGCLIKDEFYSGDFEGIVLGSVSSDDRPIRKALNKSGIRLTEDIENLLIRLQEIHDDLPPSDWQKSLDELEKTL